MKNLILISIVSFVFVLVLFAPRAQAASFEPLGPSRTLGDVYDDLMTASELNQYIDGQGMSNVTVVNAQGTSHAPNYPYKPTDIIDVSNLDVYSSGGGFYGPWDSYMIIIKGDIDKYSYAILVTHADYANYDHINVYNNSRVFADHYTDLYGRDLNISIKSSQTNPVPEPSVIYLMLACLLPVGLRGLKSCS